VRHAGGPKQLHARQIRRLPRHRRLAPVSAAARASALLASAHLASAAPPSAKSAAAAPAQSPAARFATVAPPSHSAHLPASPQPRTA